MKRHISIFPFLMGAFAVLTCSLAQNAYSADFAIIANEQMSVSYFINEQLHGSYTLTNPVSWPEEYYYSWVPLQPTHILTAESRPGRSFGWYTLAQNDTDTAGSNTSVSQCTVLLSEERQITAETIKKAKTSAHFGNGYVICPKYEDIKFDLGFDGNGATSGDMSGKTMTGLTIDDEFSLPANGYLKTGYHFAGWKTNRTEGVVFADMAQMTGSAFWNGKSFDSTLYAQWTANTYAIRFDGNGATGGSMNDESFTYDETKQLTANAFTKTGFAFDGWATNATEGAVLYKDKAPVKNLTAENGATVTLYARWTASGYTVTFDANGGSSPSPGSKTVSYGLTYGQLATCSRNGYSLDGWYTEKSGGTKIEATTTVTITGAQTLYAHWTPDTYAITYEVKQGTGSNPNPTTYTIESDDIVFLPPSEVAGYKFDKWTPVSIPKGSMGDKTVSASYLTIAYKPDVESPLTYNGYSQTCASPGNGVTASGHQATDVGKHTATYRPMSGYCWDDGTVDPYVVVWEIRNAKVENAVVTQSGTLTYTGEPQQPTVDTKAEVKGWQTVTWKYSTSQGGYTETIPAFTDAGTYTVYFEASAPNHDPATGSFTVKIDRAKTAAADISPTHLPYTRKEQGPTVTVQHCHEAADSVKRATDVGAYAVKVTPDENYAWGNGETATREFMWSIDDSLYTVQFDRNGGTGEMAPTNLAYNEEYIVPECEFTKTGCEFQRWQVLIDNRTVTNYLAGTVVSNLTTIAGMVVTFKAEWLGHYTVAFDGNGGEDVTGTMTNVTYESDREYALPTNRFAKTGYHFAGWATNGTDIAFTNCAVVSNLAEPGGICTLAAQWKEISLAEAMHCTNLVWESVAHMQNLGSKIAWTVICGEGEGFEGSGSCARQSALSEVGIPQMLTAKLVESGTLSFRWKGATVRFNISQKRDNTTAALLTLRAPSADEWNYFSTNLVVTTESWVHIWNFTPDNAVDIDQMTWVPEGTNPEPTDADKVTISSAAVSDGKFTLSFEFDEDFDYLLKTNADLLIDSWGVMEVEGKKTDNILTFEPQIIEGQPQMFYRVDTIKKE